MPRPPKIIARPPAFVSRSEKLDTDYFVYVEPCGAVHGAAALPVVVVVDGDYMFPSLLAAAKKLHSENALPAALLVGIGYGQPFGDPRNKRGRDYTPSPASEEPDSGGAATFYEHLTGPLWTELTHRYPASAPATAPRVIVGHSLGGLFALHALFQPRPFFNAAIVGAPSLWWNNGHYFTHLAQFHQTLPPLAPIRIFLAIGADDTESMTTDFARLERQLTTAPITGLETHSRKYPGHDHHNLLPVLFRDGLQSVLRDMPVPKFAKPRTNTLKQKKADAPTSPLA